MATQMTAHAALPAPDPTKTPPPPTPAPKDPLPVATSSLPKELQSTEAGQQPLPQAPASAHYFGIWTAAGAIVVLVAIAVTLFVLIRDRQDG